MDCLSNYNTEDKIVIIHLINVNPEKEIWKAKDIYPVIENKEIEIYIPSFEKKPKKVLLIKADDEKNDPEEIDFIFEGKKIKLLIPYLKIWDILVLQF
jgi:GTPase involved in cell partitioning and DNA repair